MGSSALASPANDAATQELVDWLELEAFFDRFGRAHLDEVVGHLKTQTEEQSDDIADADARKEQLVAGIESEVNRRAEGLGDAYPYCLSGDGEVLELKPRGQREASSLYILCLVLSHVTRSAILSVPPSDGAVRDVRRRHFQIFSTLALAGHADGPAVSLGWPRQDGSTILNVVDRACVNSGTGKARLQPADLANPAAKDGGIDVLGWTPVPGRPPPSQFWFAQAASGHGWKSKSSRDEAPDFIEHYFDERPSCNHSYVTICPFLVSDFDISSVGHRHGLVLDRTRAPAAALRGLRLAKDGVLVEEVNEAGALAKWLGTYRATIRAAA